MKLIVDYNLNKSKIPRDYRRGFISLVKSAFEISDNLIFKKYYQVSRIKPFTFSVYYPELKGHENGSFKVGSKAKLFLSSNQPEVITYLYNGLRNKKLYPYPLFDNSLTLERISAIFPRKVTRNSALFRTISPILINNKGKNHWYLMPGEQGFDEGLTFNIQELAKEFLGATDIDFEFEPIRYKEKKVFHYGQFMRGYHGVFRMEASAEVLDLLLNIGIGNRRSQGFGMVDLV